MGSNDPATVVSFYESRNADPDVSVLFITEVDMV